MAHIERPISPHLQIYKPQISSVLSILHRITGAALGFGLLLFAWWLIAAASGPEAFARASGFIGSVLGRLILFGFTWALFYHFCNGIRHLFWDMGKGFELPVMHRTGWAVVAGSAVLTILVWVLAYALR
ncbi:MAG: succinate dehydrogenase, cytochrome b556 subunit [Alphaproteobacteria bacterium]|nr:succinate dehydrogenase, cytochrome b556 subunit [Alphaproteobacteria bacterium]